MKQVKKDEYREKRIDMEILVDAYDEEERAMGWYYYLSETIRFPFKATVIYTRHKSPLQKDDIVEVLGMAPEDECMRDMLVDVYWDGEDITVPLAQLQGLDIDDDSREAMKDWHYWVGRWYGF